MRLLLAVLLLAALACNMPRLVLPDPTGTPAPTLPPTVAPPTLVPTFTVPPLPVKAAPTEPPPTPTAPPTQAAPTALLPTPDAALPSLTPAFVTQPPAPTVGPTATEGFPTPEARALFTGVFNGGKMTFRIGSTSASVIPKNVTLKGATCKEGGKVSTWIDFEPPPEYAIDKGRFLINYDNTVTIFGQFQSRDRVLGNITVRVAEDGDVCTVGPIPFAATP